MPVDDGSGKSSSTPTDVAAMFEQMMAWFDDLAKDMTAHMEALERRQQPPPPPATMPGYDTSAAAASSAAADSSTSATAMTTAVGVTTPSTIVSSAPRDITDTLFPHSPSQLQAFGTGTIEPARGRYPPSPPPPPDGHQGGGFLGGGYQERLGVPRFSKLDFPTYDGSVDPLNWLHRCELFFWGQRTPAVDRVWFASYHLVGAAQTWYYALELDEGTPTWDRFAVLCDLRFGPAV